MTCMFNIVYIQETTASSTKSCDCFSSCVHFFQITSSSVSATWRHGHLLPGKAGICCYQGGEGRVKYQQWDQTKYVS